LLELAAWGVKLLVPCWSLKRQPCREAGFGEFTGAPNVGFWTFVGPKPKRGQKPKGPTSPPLTASEGQAWTEPHSCPKT